ncbi:hypothetical protein ACQEU5_14870 [Marinactinospora thermotolerans]|uniref:Subtilisin inhibitor-like n=1 Tax=Marinactinospora thermotolerans DSM 45154 TaxID=1122192 RepID=A0A1T4RP84_9ACTN|nr:hypothetical protein [Marinactinospora thermotolerans]SKA17626.1 hypothetical protein SAMN02745673_02843 [Marinactinospora thermotolerans DSM 45154]
MSKLNPRRTSHGTIGTTLLGGLCLGGALVYTAMIGASLVSPPASPLSGQEMTAMSGLGDLSLGPVGNIEVRVDDGEQVYEQNLTCTGVPDVDPAACAALAERAERDETDTPFDEVAPNAVCTDLTYGPQRATITGTWEEQEIETEVTRVGSCQEARWQRLRPLTDPLE